MFKLILKIAVRYLKSQKNEHLPSLITTISFIGIVISVATLLIVIGVQNGFRMELVKQIIGINAHISITNNRGITDFEKLISDIKNNNENITEIMPLIDGKGMLVNVKNSNSAGSIIKGINPEDLLKKSKNFKFFDADIKDFKGNVIILGSDLAFMLNVYKDSFLTLISPQINETIFGIVPRSKTYKVIGVTNTGASQYNGVLGFIPFDQAQKFFQYNNAVNVVEIMIKNPDNMEGIKTKNIIPKHSYISTWQEQNEGLLNALKIEKNVMVLILSLFVVVTIFAIFAGLTMMINDKYKSIAILRSMGLSRINIGWIFFFTGIIIVVTVTLVGVGIGLLFSLNIETIKTFIETKFHIKLFDSTVYFMSTLPSDIQTNDVLYIVCFVLFCGIIASIIPAIKATKCQPGEALKYF